MTEFSLVQLRHFCAVAELGSIAEAARSRHVAATAVSSAITALESVLGTRLCVRARPRGVSLTPAGHQFYREAKRLVRAADDLVRTHRHAPDAHAGPLSIGVFGPVSPAILPGLLTAFQRSHPETKVEFTTGKVLDLVERMLAGDLHCFFSYNVFSRTGNMPEGLVAEDLYRTQLHVVLAADHPLAGRKHVSIAELIEEPMVLYESNPQRAFSEPALGKLHPAAKVRYRTSDFELMRALVARGMGYSLIMNPMPAGASYEGLPLARVALDPPIAGSSLVMIRPAGQWQHPGVRALLDVARGLVHEGGLGISL
ncbi:transcriptional regulator [Pseudoclavibacter endophyticus]|nr:LysR family transcriptional regulator [Pseudoclavibacter endophyticus]GGA74588.1 transcriptional regulator [Pseudoclavibacter endophyticus]